MNKSDWGTNYDCGWESQTGMVSVRAEKSDWKIVKVRAEKSDWKMVKVRA
jgi:hypothetical protein